MTVAVVDVISAVPSTQQGTVRVLPVNDRPVLHSCGACNILLDNYLPVDQELMAFTPAHLRTNVSVLPGLSPGTFFASLIGVNKEEERRQFHAKYGESDQCTNCLTVARGFVASTAHSLSLSLPLCLSLSLSLSRSLFFSLSLPLPSLPYLST